MNYTSSPRRFRFPFSFHLFLLITVSVVAIGWINIQASAQDEPAKPAVPEVLFDGRTLGDWKPITTFSFEKAGPVKVEEGEIQIAKGSPAGGIRWDGPELPRLDYELTLKAKRTDGDDFFCGLTFPVGDSYCTLIVGGWGGGVVGLSNVDTYSAAENSTSSYMAFEKDRWYDIRLRVTKDRIGVWIDDEQVIDLETEGHKFSIWWEQEPARPLGMATWYTASALKDIRLKKVTESPE